MMDDVSDIAEFYNSAREEEKGRLERHQLEHELTWRYLDAYLPAQGKILEIGAATGKYTLELAQRGYAVTAVDLSPVLLGECKQLLINEGLTDRVRLVVADARDLREVAERDFDAVLLMGPLYHLIEKADRELALQQVYERLRKGGLIFTSFISRFGILGDLLSRSPDWIENQAEVRSVLESGKRPDDFPRGGFRGYLAKVEEIAPLHETVGFETLVLAGVEPAISADDASYNQLQGQQRQLWLDLLYEISTEPSIVGASRHLLYLGKK